MAKTFELVTRNSYVDYAKTRSVYDIKLLYDNVRVKDFVYAVLSEQPGQSGNIKIYDSYLQDGKATCKFVKGKLLMEMPEEFMLCNVNSAVSFGNAQNMNYTLYTDAPDDKKWMYVK